MPQQMDRLPSKRAIKLMQTLEEENIEAVEAAYKEIAPAAKKRAEGGFRNSGGSGSCGHEGERIRLGGGSGGIAKSSGALGKTGKCGQ